MQDSLTNKIINDLDIRLTDSIGKPYTRKWNLDKDKETSTYRITDTLKFIQNKKNSYLKLETYNITFGVNNYMLLINYSDYPKLNENETDKIFIKDNRGRYDNISITFNKNKIVHMCIDSQIQRDEKKLNETTIKIKLKK